MTDVRPQGHIAAGGERTPGSFLIRHDVECVSCDACARSCPSDAIAFVDGCASIIEARCVRCGRCVTACDRHSFAVRDDLPRVLDLLASGRTVVALLATEYIAALHPLTFDDAERELEARGFSAVETTLPGEELVATAYEQVHERHDFDLLPRLRSTCPVAVEWVRRFHPAFTDLLVPVVPPYVAQARLIRRLYPPDTAIVYASPCWARKDEAVDGELSGEIDVAVGFDELLRLLAEPPVRPAPRSAVSRPRIPRELSATDGFPRRSLAKRDLTDRDIVTVRGLEHLDELLDAMMSGEVAPAIVDMLACDGCLDGPCVRRDMSVFAKRNLEQADRDRQPPSAVDTRTFLGVLPAIDVARHFTPLPSAPAPAEKPGCDDESAVASLGVLGKARYEALLQSETARALRYSAPLSVVRIELDDAHPGDAERATRVLSELLRSSDACGRLGETGVAVVLTHTGKTEAWAAAERWRAALAHSPAAKTGEDPITACYGIASLCHGSAGQQAGYRADAEAAALALDEAAVAALRRAKDLGPDRLEFAAG